jgi:spore coat polysaccharide biosynthesis predicted glycosyltransferase SpsG
VSKTITIDINQNNNGDEVAEEKFDVLLMDTNGGKSSAKVTIRNENDESFFVALSGEFSNETATVEITDAPAEPRWVTFIFWVMGFP